MREKSRKKTEEAKRKRAQDILDQLPQKDLYEMGYQYGMDPVAVLERIQETNPNYLYEQGLREPLW